MDLQHRAALQDQSIRAAQAKQVECLGRASRSTVTIIDRILQIDDCGFGRLAHDELAEAEIAAAGIAISLVGAADFQLLHTAAVELHAGPR